MILSSEHSRGVENTYSIGLLDDAISGPQGFIYDSARATDYGAGNFSSLP